MMEKLIKIKETLEFFLNLEKKRDEEPKVGFNRQFNFRAPQTNISNREAIEAAILIIDESKRLRDALNPRTWSKEMHDAWHKNLPDTQKGFNAILEQAPQETEDK